MHARAHPPTDPSVLPPAHARTRCTNAHPPTHPPTQDAYQSSKHPLLGKVAVAHLGNSYGVPEEPQKPGQCRVCMRVGMRMRVYVYMNCVRRSGCVRIYLCICMCLYVCMLVSVCVLEVRA